MASARGWVGTAGSEPRSVLNSAPCPPADDQSNMVIVIALVTIGAILSSVALTTYFYNRQRKIRKYKLQKAAEEALKLKEQAMPA